MRTLSPLRLGLFSLLALGACVGGLSGTNPPPPGDDGSGSGSGSGTPEDYFMANVRPITTTRCATCHTTGSPNGNVTGFVDGNAATAYDTITHYVAVVGNFSSTTAPILTKVAAGHESIQYTSAEIQKITTWLDMEFAARNPGGTGSGSGSGSAGPETAAQTTKRVLGAYSGCMTRTNFDTADMAGQVGGWKTGNNQECDNCHATGAEGFIASRAVGTGADTFYSTITTHSSYLQQYFIVDMSMGQSMAKVIMNRASFDGVSQRKAPHVEHPTFDSSDNGQGIQAITQFYNLTTANTACTASTLVD